MKTKAMTTLTLSILLLALCGIFSGAYAGDPLPLKPTVTSPLTRPLPAPPVSTGIAEGGRAVKPPDLIVRELWTNERCQIVVTVANQGPGVLPDNAWPSSLLAIGLRGAVAGTVPLATVDPGRHLRVPGGTATYVSRFTVPAGGAPVDAVVDNNNKVAEANEDNNTLARVLTCAAASVTPPPSGGMDKANPMPPVTTPGAGKGGAPNTLLPAVAPAPAAGAAAVQAVRIEQLSKAQFKALADEALIEIEGKKIRKADVVADFKRRAAAARAGATVYPSKLAEIQARIRAEEDAVISASAAEVRRRLAEILAQGGDR